MVDSLRELGVQVDREPHRHIHLASQAPDHDRSGPDNRPLPLQLVELVAVAALAAGLDGSDPGFAGPMDSSQTPSRSSVARPVLNFLVSPDPAHRQMGQRGGGLDLEGLEQ